MTAQAFLKRREQKRLESAGKGKKEKRFQDIDLWPIVVRENILDEPDAPEKVFHFAQRSGGEAMVAFCFKNWPRLPELIIVYFSNSLACGFGAFCSSPNNV